MEELIDFVVIASTIVIASTFHEYAHAWTAYKLGDITPRIMGRLTLDPLKHIDPIGALSLLFLRIGWSKPVPVNPANFENPLIGNAIVAIAGPLSNLFMIVITAILTRLIDLFASDTVMGAIYIFVIPFIRINSIFMIFNLLPIPPLDGSRIIKVIVPPNLRRTWENLDKYGFIILIALIIIPYSPFAIFLDWLLQNGISSILSITLGT